MSAIVAGPTTMALCTQYSLLQGHLPRRQSAKDFDLTEALVSNDGMEVFSFVELGFNPIRMQRFS